MPDYIPEINNPLYDIIVVGAGHAGCEAAHAAARMGCRTLLFTIDLDKLAQMSCNPSIGGPAKSQLVREIDALGGLMGRITDMSFIQVRLLNESKGPAVQSVRAQADKRLYARLMKEILEATPNLLLRQAMIEDIKVLSHEAAAEIQAAHSPNTTLNPHSVPRFAVITNLHQVAYARAVVLTTGTFLRGKLITGETVWKGGRIGEPPSDTLAESLASLGFPLVRLKTGTPPRIDARTIDFTETTVQYGSAAPLYFGHYYQHPHYHQQPENNTPPLPYDHQHPAHRDHPPPDPFATLPAAVYPHPLLDVWRKQLPCYMIYTTARFHEHIRANLHRAPLFSGTIEGVGPRYCPSIEDKIVRFADKDRHTLFLEPEGWTTGEVYVQGCNTSLPEDVQWEMLRSIPSLRAVELLRIGYAIEYDAVATGEINADLSTRRMPGLYLAGQINGTTGYEEAAAQGIMAGINAARWLRGEQSIILRRDEAYIGVLLDDLVTKEIREPYRMFTSRAEHRLLIRGDNADLRLTPLAHTLRMVEHRRAEQVEQKRAWSEELQTRLAGKRVFPGAAINTTLAQAGLAPLSTDVSVAALLRRPGVRYHLIQAVLELPEFPPDVIEQVELAALYGTYIVRQQREAERVRRMEHRRIPPDLDYNHIKGLRAEARQLLQHFRPATLGQAGRLAGVNPSDVAIVLFALERQYQTQDIPDSREAQPTPD
jgi:tRNA uridine 5-carboxymethylaminomethyl modification enzyme